ncbi:hypothetical protein [Bogoriella caseilytica]|uniref:Uncharacterized protein n=1 Tax=Bogoriella caseilytica TaxID=56055 RepID=A0A3N2BDY1_9MICO|nr:hypothetical protein [Bogoriella caseilytica]ROR73463.1 hypothetical protein EDD31_1844 [Bogoriella caseilytica]
MIDLAEVDPRLYDTVAPVVDELVTQTDLDPQNILLVGAACRDILHAGFGHAFQVRATTDTDLGIAVSDTTISDRIDQRLTRTGSNGIRYRVGCATVDIMPFGQVKEPEGISRHISRREQLVVFGFRDVFQRSQGLTLPGGCTIRLPHPAGYAALKMRAWIDRCPDHHWTDAQDLALAAYWYQES